MAGFASLSALYLASVSERYFWIHIIIAFTETRVYFYER